LKNFVAKPLQRGLAGLSRRFSPGRPNEKRNAVKGRIKEIISQPPDLYGYVDRVWTVPLVTHDIKKKLNISISNDTVIRALKDLGYSYKRPSKTMPPTAPTREEKIVSIKKMLNEIEAIIKDKDSLIYALDESHFSTEPYLVQGWFFKRWPPPDMYQQQKRKSHILWMLESKDKKVLLEAIKSR
jgi:transposase